MNLKEALSVAKQNYRVRTKKSGKEYQIAKQYMPGGVTRFTNFYFPYPVTITKSIGPELFDLDGSRYLDLIYNYGSIIHGHAHPEIMNRVKLAMESGSAVAASIPEHTKFAEMLCKRIPSIEQLRFCNSGLEATMFAIRAARAYTGKPAIIKMEGGYHGLHDTVEFSTHPPVSLERNWAPIPDSIGITENVGRDVFIAPFNNSEAIESILLAKADQIAAIIVEPVLGACGMIPPIPGYLADLRRLADKYNVLLIFDEVQTLRMDIGGAQSLYEVIPDITAIAKIIGGGFPVGAFGGRAEIMAMFDPNKDNHVTHGGTFSGNNITMTAGIAAMELLDKKAIDHLEKISIRLEEGMKVVIKKFSIPAFVTRGGSMLHLHFTHELPVDYATARSYLSNELANLIHLEFLNRGIFVSPRGTWYLSIVMEDYHIDEIIEKFTEVMQKVSLVLEGSSILNRS